MSVKKYDVVIWNTYYAATHCTRNDACNTKHDKDRTLQKYTTISEHDKTMSTLGLHNNHTTSSMMLLESTPCLPGPWPRLP